VTPRLAVLLVAVGLILLAAALRAGYQRWRDRPSPPAEVAQYAGNAPLPVTAYAAALAVGALDTLRAGDVLDAVGCRRPGGRSSASCGRRPHLTAIRC
jgi:hypothetical protein